MKLPLLLLKVILITVLFTACGENYLYEKHYEMPAAGWAYQDSLDFSFSIEDTLQIYDLLLEVDHVTGYRFQNLYTKIHTTFPDGQRLSEQLSLELADKLGVWQGDCNAEACSLEIPIQQGAYFNQPGQYRITLEQYMRVNPLPDVTGFTFRIKPTEARRSD